MVNLLNWTEARKFQTFKAIKMARIGNIPPTCDLVTLPVMGGHSVLNLIFPSILEILSQTVDCQMKITRIFISHKEL